MQQQEKRKITIQEKHFHVLFYIYNVWSNSVIIGSSVGEVEFGIVLLNIPNFILGFLPISKPTGEEPSSRVKLREKARYELLQTVSRCTQKNRTVTVPFRWTFLLSVCGQFKRACDSSTSRSSLSRMTHTGRHFCSPAFFRTAAEVFGLT